MISIKNKNLIKKSYFGVNSYKNINNILNFINPKNILIIHGKKSYYKSKSDSLLSNYFKKYKSHEFSDFSSNPKLKDIKNIIPLLRNVNTIIGIGGGSSIDVSKWAKLEHYKTTNKKIPLIVLPTTSGSGSESTYYIVYYKKNKKISDGEPDITLPDYVICDPTLTMSVPPKIAAASGLDALSQAIESFWNINSTKRSKRYSIKSINILMKYLVSSVINPSIINKTKIMKAANLSGKAINISKTTSCHAISYFISAKYDIPHGHAVALTLGEIIKYNISSNNHPLLKILETNTSEKAKNKINNIIDKIGLERKLSNLNIKKKDLPEIASSVNTERLKNNPISMNYNDILDILYKIY